LRRKFGITFNRLLTITNQPIARFAEDLRKQGRWDEYLELLANSFNPATVDGLMCRTTLSVGYRGELYDCDFNQMLDMQMRNGKPLYLWDIARSMWKTDRFKPALIVLRAPPAAAAVALVP